jgi:hypothetical protein
VPQVIIEDFRLGLDRRKSILTAAAGSLWVLRNAHITAGGEIHKRKAFVPDKTLPAGQTKGLAVLAEGIFVFGHAATPGGVPAGVTYQRLQHPTGEALSKVLDYDVFDGKIYVTAQFADGSVFHFYDGARVVDWYDGSARAAFAVRGGPNAGGVRPSTSFNVTAGTAGAGTGATTSFQITGGTAGAGNQITSVTVGGVNILGAPVLWTTSNNNTATLVAAQINSFASNPEFAAVASTNTVTITGPIGTAQNGVVPVVTVGGTATASAPAALSGGALPNQITSITVNSVDILGTPVLWTTSNNNTAALVAARINAHTSSPDYTATSTGATVTILGPIGSGSNGFVPAITANNVTTSTPAAFAGGVATATISSITVAGVQILNTTISWATNDEATATAIAAQINSFVSSPEYVASAAGDTVTIAANTPGVAANGRSYAVVSAGDVAVSPASGTLEGGADPGGVSPPGTVVLTHKAKIYSVSGKTLHFSGTGVPTAWQPNGAAGAGFINMGIQDGEAENLVAVETYYDKIAIFGRRSVQIWTVTQDPAGNVSYQTLKNGGAIAGRAVRQYGNADVFFLSDSGLRSLRARDSSNVAAVNDVGTPIDDLIAADIATLGDAVADAVSGIEPVNGRFLLALGLKLYVFSFFPASKISAWSIYEPGFPIDHIDVQNDQIVVRSGDTIYRYGGADNATFGNNYPVEIVPPLIDARSPATEKSFHSIDLGCSGSWEVHMGTDPANPETRDLIGTIARTTYGLGRVSVALVGTHASLRFVHQGNGPATISNLILHYEGGETG